MWLEHLTLCPVSALVSALFDEFHHVVFELIKAYVPVSFLIDIIE